jgi:hypothetical protein
MPEQLFYRVPVEDKPLFVDFSSIVLVDILARAVRRSVAESEDALITFTEVLPGSQDTWLRDSEGRRYTSEFRMVAVDTAGVDPSWVPHER